MLPPSIIKKGKGNGKSLEDLRAQFPEFAGFSWIDKPTGSAVCDQLHIRHLDDGSYILEHGSHHILKAGSQICRDQKTVQRAFDFFAHIEPNSNVKLTKRQQQLKALFDRGWLLSIVTLHKGCVSETCYFEFDNGQRVNTRLFFNLIHNLYGSQKPYPKHLFFKPQYC